jgi:hypothetical protein
MNVNGAGALSFGSASNTRTLTVTNDLTVAASATLQSGASGGTAHTINIGRHFSNAGTVNMTVGGPTSQTIAFNGSVDQDLSGAGTFTFYNLTVAGTAGVININKSILINGGANALTFSANRLLNVNATSNITLGTTATISGANTNRISSLMERQVPQVNSLRILLPPPQHGKCFFRLERALAATRRWTFQREQH